MEEIQVDKTFMTIRETARAGLVSEHFLRVLEAEGRLPGIYTGNRKLVNVPLLVEQLNRESMENAGGE